MHRIAVCIPCLNEAASIRTVIRSFREALPESEIYVCDNGSTDQSAEIALQEKAHLIVEPRKGKGFVIRRLFRDIDADIYVLVDGDDTYDAAISPVMVKKMLTDGIDLVNGVRIKDQGSEVYRLGHQFGNRVLTKIVRMLFGDRIQDMLSGYKVLSRRFVKSFPSMSGGFEIEIRRKSLFTLLTLIYRSPIFPDNTGHVPKAPSASSIPFRMGFVFLCRSFLF